MKGLQLSIVVVAYNNWWLTRRCLHALDDLRRTSAIAFETIVVDNASSDETQASMHDFGWVKYIREEINTNFGGGANRGAKIAEAPLIMFLNNDAVPVGDALAPLVAAFTDEQVVIVGGCMLYEDGPVQMTDVGVLVNAPDGGWWTSYRNMPADLPEVQRSREVVGINAASMVVEKAWFESVGGFDEGFINGSEDLDLFMHAHRSGRTLRYIAEAIFYHYESASSGRPDFDEQNARRLFQRWGAEMRSLPRIERGEIDITAIQCGAAVRKNPALRYALEDLIVGLGQLGHPIVRGKIKPWAFLDRRFRQSATLEWFPGEKNVSRKHPTVTVSSEGSLAAFHTFGAEEISIPWLPCALPDAAERCAFFYDGREAAVRPNNVLDVSKGRQGVALAILPGLTDACAYGNLALAHAGVPVVIADTSGVRNVYCDDTAVIVPPENLMERAQQALGQPELLRGNAERMKADATRRFSARRAAVRFTDLARVARNGLERYA